MCCSPLPSAASPSRCAGQPHVEGHERILLIDDEVAVVRATKDLLENFGYEVEAFTQPASALRQFLALGQLRST